MYPETYIEQRDSNNIIREEKHRKAVYHFLYNKNEYDYEKLFSCDLVSITSIDKLNELKEIILDYEISAKNNRYGSNWKENKYNKHFNNHKDLTTNENLVSVVDDFFNNNRKHSKPKITV